MPTDTVLHLSDLKYGWTPETTLINISELSIRAGESLFLRGASGSGKSTLLGLIGGVLSPRSGDIKIMGRSIIDLSSSKRDQIRSDHLGIIFQQFNLLPYLSVVGNVTLPCRFSKKRREISAQSHSSPEEEAMVLIRALGLPETVLDTPVGQLSVGQQQRVAVARALIGGPDLIIADEPTSALDTENRDRFIELLNEQRQAFNTSLLFVSHDRSLAKHFDRDEDLAALNTSSDAKPKVHAT